MLIRPSKYVDLSGRIYHPYLATWRDRPDDCAVTDFMEILQGIFGAEPPVYTKPAAAKPRSPSTPGPSQPLQPQPPVHHPQPPPQPQPQPQVQPVSSQSSSFSQTPSIPPERPAAFIPPPRTLRSASPPLPPDASLLSTPSLASPPLPNVALRDPLLPTPTDPRAALRLKVKQSFASYSSTMTEAMERQLMVNKRLHESEKRFSDAIRALNDARNRAETEAKAFKGATEGLEKWLDTMRGKEAVDPDSALQCTSAVHQQCVLWNANVY